MRGKKYEKKNKEKAESCSTKKLLWQQKTKKNPEEEAKKIRINVTFIRNIRVHYVTATLNAKANVLRVSTKINGKIKKPKNENEKKNLKKTVLAI